MEHPADAVRADSGGRGFAPEIWPPQGSAHARGPRWCQSISGATDLPFTAPCSDRVAVGDQRRPAGLVGAHEAVVGMRAQGDLGGADGNGVNCSHGPIAVRLAISAAAPACSAVTRRSLMFAQADHPRRWRRWRRGDAGAPLKFRRVATTSAGGGGLLRWASAPPDVGGICRAVPGVTAGGRGQVVSVCTSAGLLRPARREVPGVR